MLEEPCITQMKITRYAARPDLRPADDQRARIAHSLAEVHSQLAQAAPIGISTIMRRWLLVAFVAGGACGVVDPAGAQDAAAGEAVFKSQCGICHSVQSGRNQVGPSLFGIVGRPAGKAPGFHYSPANRDSGLTWDAATLDRYLTSPGTVVPHTIMTYGGLKDAKKRADLIAYLSTLH
jgi:cytochrome c